MAIELTKFSGTAPAGLTTTDTNASTFNNSPMEPYINRVGVGTEEVTFATLGKYNIDIYGDLLTYNPKDTPLLTILANTSGAPMEAPIVPWSEEYEGNSWVDIKLDDLRESTRNSSSSVYSGRLAFESVTTLPSSGTNAVFGGTALTELALSTGNTLTLAFDTSSDNIRGKKSEVIRKLANTLDAADYTLTEFDDAAGAGWYLYTYTSGTSSRVFFAFDDLAMKCGSVFYQEHEKIVGIKNFYYKDDTSALILVLDFSESTMQENLDSTPANNIVLLEEVSTGSGTAFSANYTGYFSRMARMVLIGNVYDVPGGIPEGDDFSEGGNYIFGRDEYTNYAQIFTSPKYGITGTAQATSYRFGNDFQKSRARHLGIYKNKIAAALMFGAQSFKMSSDGMPQRTMSGIFDYGLFPIRYMRKHLPDISSGTPVGRQLTTWLDSIAHALNAFRQDGSDAHTCVTSSYVIQRLREWAAYIGTMQGNVFGATFTTPPPSSASLFLDIVEYKSNNGTLRFVEDPALNFMPRFPKSTNSATAGSARGGAPIHLFSSGLNPRNLILAVDKAHIEFLTLRSDQIHGNIQSPGKDMFQEAMRGEHSMRLRFPRNHAVIDVA